MPIDRAKLANDVAHAPVEIDRAAVAGCSGEPFDVARHEASKPRLVRADDAGVHDGLRLVGDALALSNEQGDMFWMPDLHRLRGDLLLMVAPSDTDEPEACFREAIAVARRDSAKLWELRAATSLARLLQRNGRYEAARRDLSAVYGWFTEGLDTADLKRAKALLDELSREVT
ncbi:MAG: hypothetical protein ACREQ9_10540 [Candidatus Binatia bacterium]